MTVKKGLMSKIHKEMDNLKISPRRMTRDLLLRLMARTMKMKRPASGAVVNYWGAGWVRG